MRLAPALVAAFRALGLPAEALMGFARHDGLALASHIALSLVLSLFPFLIAVAALAAFLETGRIAHHVVHLVFDLWPEEVSGPLAREARKVLGLPRGSLLTLSLIATVIVASNGVGSLRTALNRAYGVERPRSWWRTRLIGLLFVVAGAAILVGLSVLVLFWPSFWRAIVTMAPDLRGVRITSDSLRYALGSATLAGGLLALHLWLPDTRQRVRDAWPGVAATLGLWLAAATLFSELLATFTQIKSTYAGLAGIFTALIFLQLCAAIFILGAELNAALQRRAMEAAASRFGLPEAAPG